MSEPLLVEEPWQSFAACDPRRGLVETSLFFDETTTGLAKQFCRTNCPARFDCLDYAYRMGCDHGVYGGFDERERERMMKNYGPKGIATLITKQRLTTKEVCNADLRGRDGLGAQRSDPLA